MTPDEVPLVISGAYGLGSRDFRPEAVIGAYEYTIGERSRQDGRKLSDGETYFVLGIDHPYAVEADRKPSLLPENSIAVRLHSIGGWGMITTGKNLGEIIGAVGDDLIDQHEEVDEFGRPKEVLHVSAKTR